MTRADVPEVPDRETVSRRGLMRKVGGAVAAGVAGAAVGNVLSATPAAADDGDAVILGAPNTAASGTYVLHDLNLFALLADPTQNIAVYGRGQSRGVVGETVEVDSIGVEGITSGHSSQTAVRGDARDRLGEGIGVHGATKNGIGVLAEATGGYALQVRGRAVFSRSGKVSFTQGQVARGPIAATLTNASLVVATIQGAVAGTWVQGVVVDVPNSRFTIRLNKAAPANLTVGYFIVN